MVDVLLFTEALRNPRLIVGLTLVYELLIVSSDGILRPYDSDISEMLTSDFFLLNCSVALVLYGDSGDRICAGQICLYENDELFTGVETMDVSAEAEVGGFGRIGTFLCFGSDISLLGVAR